MQHKEQYITDERGNRTGVILEIAEYEKILEDLEELESVRAYGAAKTSGERAVSLEDALATIDRERR